MPQLDGDKITVITIKNMKEDGEKISAVTSYDYPSAKIASKAGIDIILVGDSLGMVLHGDKNTLKVDVDDIIYHTSMVTKAEPLSLVVSDMPFQSYHVSVEKAVENALKIVKRGGAEAVKLEGGRKRFNVIEAIINAEIPVMGHLGLTPQSINSLGAYQVQGKVKKKAIEIIQDAIGLEKIGVFALVLESIPLELAKIITEKVSIPTIGIGAGKYCDGQVMVFHDLIGFTNLYLPKFVRKYADVYSVIYDALERYIKDIKKENFPGDKESYHLNKDIDEFLK